MFGDASFSLEVLRLVLLEFLRPGEAEGDLVLLRESGLLGSGVNPDTLISGLTETGASDEEVVAWL